MVENFDWLKNNCKIFLDECVCIKTCCRIKAALEQKGYKNVFDVYDVGLNGKIDNKILRYIIDNKMILITFDKKFIKTSLKYNKNMVVPLKQFKGKMGGKSMANKIQCFLDKNSKEIKEYYLNSQCKPEDNNG